ncbi:geranylgeranyl pyrophosphate synthetase [Scheffersomyces spartinae]|uniref:Geranylgeranyl pyrophosphate synthetase n=1 Tax=Scheffersomyces spartinae TaxID=45513 RepID=A0A9P7VEW3_9ASCO|nr:geranylgeranyl pyrophosphate synthetase [Scheffersomyces spartinae]KAG7196163.1 geranylgeranyl pyrophosphate synthetase [Scheffersomyces spartinae]
MEELRIDDIIGVEGISNLPVELLEPYDYLLLIPGSNKNVRALFLQAFNDFFFHMPNDKLLQKIGEVILIFHNSSLLIDDIEDNSDYRRGMLAAHKIYGIPLTINCGNTMYFVALKKAQTELIDLVLESRDAIQFRGNIDPLYLKYEVLNILIEEMLSLHRGQGLEIYWRDNLSAIKENLPTLSGYMSMVLGKTGGLFRLSVKLLKLILCPNEDLDVLLPIANLMGIIYQIRDDYLNLVSDAYANAKGTVGEDLLEGKLSFPILHCLRHTNNSPVHKLLMENGDRSQESIAECIAYMKDESGSLKYCLDTLKTLEARTKKLINDNDSNLAQLLSKLCSV